MLLYFIFYYFSMKRIALVTLLFLSILGSLVITPGRVLADTTLWEELNGNIYFLSGKLGLGVNDPEVDLEIQEDGAFKLGTAYISDGQGQLANWGYNTWFNGSQWVVPDSTKRAQLLMMYNGELRNFLAQTPGGTDFQQNFTIDSDGDIKAGVGGNWGRVSSDYQGGKNIVIYDANSPTSIRFRSGNEGTSSNDTVIKRETNGSICIGLASVCGI